MVIAVLATVLVIAAIGAGAFVLNSQGKDKTQTDAGTAVTVLKKVTTSPTIAKVTAPPTTAPPTTPPPTTAPPATVAPTIPPTIAPPPPAFDSNALSYQQLVRERDVDRYAVANLVGTWVPQVSSKKDGLRTDGVTYDDNLILRNFTDWQQRFAGALLLYSSDYPTFQSHDFWVTIVGVSFGTAAEANGWCDANGLSVNDCFARLISTTSGPTGASVLRR